MAIWHEIKNIIEQGCSLYLLTVVESEGSAPGRRGFKMLVSETDYLYGSIGGGIMEFNMVEKAKALLVDKTIQHQVIRQDHRGTSNTSSGMICSGSQVIAFNYLGRDDLMLVDACTQTSVMLEFSENGLKSCDETDECFIMKFSNVWSYTEFINNRDNIIAHIFGAGHVSVPTSELLSKLGFEVRLYDNREDINTFNDNEYASIKKNINYADIANSIAFGSNDYVLLMTHKFTEDKLLLSQLLNINVAYLGVLGSENKISIMFKALLTEGFSQEQLDKVFAPIGLSIKSETTEEIAISIAAEIIRIKNS